jgi:hypothetical protein
MVIASLSELTLHAGETPRQPQPQPILPRIAEVRRTIT